MRECGEDLLVDLSEILFNELAFFRLMQDLDDPKAKVKAKLRQWRQADQVGDGGVAFLSCYRVPPCPGKSWNITRSG